MSTPLTDTTFSQGIQSGLTLVDFWAPWCGPCRILSPVLEELAAEFKGKIEITKLNVDENPAVASQFGIMSIPTMIFFKDGQPIEKISGYHPKEVLQNYLTSKLTNQED